MSQPIRLELPTGFQFGTVNVYLFTEPEAVLVDTGIKSEASWAALQAGLSRHGLTVADLARVVITHPHVDHCGQAGRISAASQADIWIADLGQPWLLELPNLLLQRRTYYQQVYLPRWDFPAGLNQLILDQLAMLASVCEAAPAERVTTFQVGATLQLGGLPWQALHAPGHASAQTCFYQAGSRQLLAADMLLARTPAPVLERPAEGDAVTRPALAQFLESLDMVEALEIEQVYPGHGEPFTDHRPVIQSQRERIGQRLVECLQLIERGHRTVAALLAEMYPGQFHLTGLWMLLGYLDMLAAQGQVEVQAEAGVWRYSRRIE
mgnify:CR=1 FL=1